LRKREPGGRVSPRLAHALRGSVRAWVPVLAPGSPDGVCRVCAGGVATAIGLMVQQSCLACLSRVYRCRTRRVS